jgi:type I restriction enzyme R subunit
VEAADISNIDYFGEPLYTYSLKQGIEDSFLAIADFGEDIG